METYDTASASGDEIAKPLEAGGLGSGFAPS